MYMYTYACTHVYNFRKNQEPCHFHTTMNLCLTGRRPFANAFWDTFHGAIVNVLLMENITTADSEQIKLVLLILSLY